MTKEDLEVITEAVEGIERDFEKIKIYPCHATKSMFLGHRLKKLAHYLKCVKVVGDFESDKIIFISDDWCKFKIDQNGYVLEKQVKPGSEDACHNESISRFDIADWVNYWGRKELPETLSILDLGYWYGPKNAYEPSDSGYRSGLKEEKSK